MKAHEAVQLVEASPLFDAKWYVERYPDVKAANMNPAAHYCKYGWQMLRDPSNQFSTVDYLTRHKDVKKKGLNPLFHYLRYGKKEGRKIVASQIQRALNSPNIAKQVVAQGKSSVTQEQNNTKVTNQLAETQALLEHYYIRCQELEYQRLDHTQTVKMESL